MKPGRIALAVGSALAAAYAAGLVYEIDFAPAGCCGLGWPSRDPAVAQRALIAADPASNDAKAQRRAALAFLAAAPADSTAWMRLAWSDRLEHGFLTPAGVQALAASYLVQPYAGGQTVWRVGFALDNWSRLDPEAREGALREIRIVRADPDHWRGMRAAIRSPQDPGGRAEAALLGLI